MPDPETKGLIRMAMLERMALEDGRMKLEDAIYQPPGTRLENRKVILPSTGVGGLIGLLLSVVGAVGLLL
jgi:hypothetical protein